MAPTEVDIHDLLCHYNSLYFDNDLGACVVSWTDSRITRCADICQYEEGFCEINLSKPLLSHYSSVDIKNTLLHEMIHAYLWTKHQNSQPEFDGQMFLELVDKIECSLVDDCQRPDGGYKIPLDHKFDEETLSRRVQKWTCDGCGDSVEKLDGEEPSCSDFIGKVQHDGKCENPSCSWHRHILSCSGRYVKMEGPLGGRRKRGLKGQADTSTPPINATQKKERNCKSIYKSSSSEARKSKDECSLPIAILEDKCNPSLTTSDHPTHFTRGIVQRKQGIEGKDQPESYNSDSQARKGSQPREVKDTGLKAFWPVVPGKVRSARTIASSNKRKRDNEENSSEYWSGKTEYTIVSAWLGLYCSDGDVIEDEAPLVNKRTERRKKQKLLNNLKGIVLEDQNVLGVSAQTSGSGNSNLNMSNNFAGKNGAGKIHLTDVTNKDSAHDVEILDATSALSQDRRKDEKSASKLPASSSIQISPPENGALESVLPDAEEIVEISDG